MHTLLGVGYRLLHNLERFRFVGITLYRWSLLLLVVGAALAWFGFLPGETALAIALLVVVLALVLSQAWARRRFYAHFMPATTPSPPAPSPLAPSDKVAIWATGLFAVDERLAAFSHLPGFYRSYPNREHAILARKTPSRFLGLTDADPDFLGMWYVFISPAALTGVQQGTIYFGRTSRPALRLAYARKNKKKQQIDALAYLGFDTEGELQRVWADLLVELPFASKAPEQLHQE